MSSLKGAYARGAAFERVVAAHLRSQGALACRTAGSHGAADVWALWNDGAPWLIQCKTSGVISRIDRRALVALAHHFHARPMLAHRKIRGMIAFEVMDF